MAIESQYFLWLVDMVERRQRANDFGAEFQSLLILFLVGIVASRTSLFTLAFLCLVSASVYRHVKGL